MKLPAGIKHCGPCGHAWTIDPVCPKCGRPPGRAGRGKGTSRKAETALVRGCLGKLAAKGVWAWRSNSGAMVLPETATAARRYVKFNGAPGMSDIIGIWPPGKFPTWFSGRFLAVECKVGRNKPTAAQQAFLDRVNESGGLAVCVWSVEELEAWLRSHGL